MDRKNTAAIHDIDDSSLRPTGNSKGNKECSKMVINLKCSLA